MKSYLYLKLIDSNPNQGLILDACNRFYTLIPHDFGLKKPTILSEKKLIKVTSLIQF